MSLLEVGCAPVTERQVGNGEVWIELLEHEEGVGYADRSFEEATGRFHVLRWMVGDKAVERGFELAARICTVSQYQLVSLVIRPVLTSLHNLPIVLEIAWRHLNKLIRVQLIGDLRRNSGEPGRPNARRALHSLYAGEK